jgi:hypothetical protein
VAVAAMKGDRTLVELAEQFDVHPNQIQDWKARVVSQAEHLFENGNRGLYKFVFTFTSISLVVRHDLGEYYTPDWLAERGGPHRLDRGR